MDFYSKPDWNTGKRNSKFATTHVIGFVQYTDWGSRTVSHSISYSRAAVHVTVEATYYTAFIFTSGNVIWSVAHSWRTLNVTWCMPLSVQSAIARKSFYRLWAIECPITQPLTRFSLSDWRFVVHLLHWRSQEEDVKKHYLVGAFAHLGIYDCGIVVGWRYQEKFGQVLGKESVSVLVHSLRISRAMYLSWSRYCPLRSRCVTIAGA